MVYCELRVRNLTYFQHYCIWYGSDHVIFFKTAPLALILDNDLDLLMGCLLHVNACMCYCPHVPCVCLDGVSIKVNSYLPCLFCWEVGPGMLT